MKAKLAIISTHPIQYNAPLFKLLTKRGNVDLKVFYTWSQAKEKVEDKGFGKDISWDIPLLEGYEYEFIENTSKSPGNKSYKGIINPEVVLKIKAYDPQAIMVFGWNFHSHLNVMRHFKGRIPVWFRGDSHLLDEGRGIKTLLRRAFLRWVYLHVDKAFYVGEKNRAYFIKHGLEKKQLIYAPHAIENDRFFENEDARYEEKARYWRKKLGYTKSERVILFAGKFESKKNPALLIQAIQQINKSSNAYTKSANRQLKLLLVGNGPLEDELKELANGSEHIQFLPFQNQSIMPQVYRLGDVFCLPSQGPGETWGLAINEAMACSRPVIASNKVGGATDLIQAGENGYIFNSRNLDDLVQKISKVFEDNEKIRFMGRKSLLIIEEFSYNEVCRALEQELCE